MGLFGYIFNQGKTRAVTAGVDEVDAEYKASVSKEPSPDLISKSNSKSKKSAAKRVIKKSATKKSGKKAKVTERLSATAAAAAIGAGAGVSKSADHRGQALKKDLRARSSSKTHGMVQRLRETLRSGISLFVPASKPSMPDNRPHPAEYLATLKYEIEPLPIGGGMR